MAEIDQKEWVSHAWEFAEFLSSLCSPPSQEPTEEWAEKHVIVQDGPFAGSRWRLQFTPFAKCIFEAMRNPAVKRITIMMSAQYVKTTVLLIDFLRSAKEDPADAMWVMADADHMTEFVSNRLLPYVEDCDLVSPLLKMSRKGLIQFDSMNLMLRGSNSRAKLQSNPIRRIYCDERREWKKGSIDLLRKRLRTFPNAQEISAGTAGEENDELHADYREGSQTRANIRCLKCNHSQPIRFGRDVTALWPNPRECGGFVWETSETTKPNGVWNWPALAKTVFFECENPACRARFSNNDKYELLRSMHPNDYNPTANPEYKSFGGSAFEAIWESCDWDKLVEEFLKAVEEARHGNIEPMKAFVTETLGEPWQDRLGVIEDFGFLEARKAPYEFGDTWPESKRRFMAADKQEFGGENYPYVIREFGDFGRSRLVSYGVAKTKEELEQIRKDNGVAKGDAMKDSGYHAQEVYRFCAATGWKAFKGDDVEYYLVTKVNPSNRAQRKVVRQIWNTTEAVVYNAKTKMRIGAIRLFRFSSDSTKDLLMEYMTGLVGEWTVPEKTSKDYFKQLTAERRIEKVDGRGRVAYQWHRVSKDNHYFDCEQMILIAAIASKTINSPNAKPTSGKTSDVPPLVNDKSLSTATGVRPVGG